MSEKFNPRDPQFKKVDDLPQEEQKKFSNVEGGGFIRKEAMQEDLKLTEAARRHNRNCRSFMEKVLGKRKLNNKDVANIEALDRDWFETAQVKARVIKESLPTELREKLKEAVFVGERVYGLDAEKDLREEITAKGFDEALKTANAHYSWEYSNCYWSNVLLKYSDENTEATVEGFSTGDYPSPDVNIKHNGQEYSWREFMPAY